MKKIFLLSFAIIMVTSCGSTKTGGGIIEPTVSNKKEKDWIVRNNVKSFNYRF